MSQLMCFHRHVKKALLMSLIIATFVIPIRGARNLRQKRPLKHAVTQMAIFIVLWVLTLKYVYWSLPE